MRVTNGSRFMVFTVEPMTNETNCVFVSEHIRIECALEQIELEKNPWKTPKDLGESSTIAKPWNSLSAISIALFDKLSGVAQMIMGDNQRVFEKSIKSVTTAEWQWGKIM